MAIKHRVLVLALFAALLVTTTVPPATAQNYKYDAQWWTPKVLYATKRSNVRAGPGTSYGKVGLLEVGEEVRVTAKTGSWFKLEPKAGQRERFVYAPLLTDLTVKTITYSNGRYHGQTRNGESHGRGVYTWADGARYEGDFVVGKISGRGVYTWGNGNRYEGEFRDDKFHGRGVLTRADGSRYEGNFVDGKRSDILTSTPPGGQAWGATAVETDPVDGPRYKVCDERGFAISVNFEGPAEAGADARTQCSARSGDCDVKRYFDECAAFAQGYMDYADGGRYCVYGLGVGDSRNSASARAMDVCRSDALQPLVSGLGLTHLEHTDKVYGCEIRSTACNNITELRKRQQQVTQRVESQRQRQQPVQTTDSGGWVAVTDGYRNGRGEGGVVGVAAGRRSRSDALRAAMRDCENSGGVSCGQRSGKDAWEERCIAVAEASWMGEDEMFFNGTGDTRSEAKDEAKSYCRNAGATGCFIAKAECG